MTMCFENYADAYSQREADSVAWIKENDKEIGGDDGQVHFHFTAVKGMLSFTAVSKNSVVWNLYYYTAEEGGTLTLPTEVEK